MTGDVTYTTEYYIKCINRPILVNLQEANERLANSSTRNAPMALKFMFPLHLISTFLVILSSKNIKQGHFSRPDIFICLLAHGTLKAASSPVARATAIKDD